MGYWLMKSEPSAFSIDDLINLPNQTTPWEGVRNYQARNMLRNNMRKGELAFFYHSSCPSPGIFGIVEIVKPGYPDSTAFDPESPYFDPKSTSTNPRWYRVDVTMVKKFSHPIYLAELKQHPELRDLPLLRKGNRLSVMPVSPEQWNSILTLEIKRTHNEKL